MVLQHLFRCPELEQYGCAVLAHISEKAGHPLEGLEVITTASGSPPQVAPAESDTVEWNQGALAELERGVRRSVAKAFGQDTERERGTPSTEGGDRGQHVAGGESAPGGLPKRRAVKDIRLHFEMLQVAAVWLHFRGETPLYFGQSRCDRPLLRHALGRRAHSTKLDISWRIWGTPEIDPTVEFFELSVESYQFEVRSPRFRLDPPDRDALIENCRSAFDFEQYLDAVQGGHDAGREYAGRQAGTTQGAGSTQGAVPEDRPPLPDRKIVYHSSRIPGTARSLTVPHLRPSCVYFLRLRATTPKWSSEWSNELKLKTEPGGDVHRCSRFKDRNRPI